MGTLTSSYGIEIKHVDKIFTKTISIYRDAVSFCIDVFNKEWNDLQLLKAKSRNNYAEHLVHSTSKNVVKYPDFDRLFYKMPSYMRRAAISDALGAVSSYRSALDRWVNNGKAGKQPALQTKRNTMPTFYKGDTSKLSPDEDCIKLKVFNKNDWRWIAVSLKHTDMQYLRRHFDMKGISSPTLEKRNHKWFLRFSFDESYALIDKDYTEQSVLAVDLGVNTDATCSVMKSDGTVLARKFINFASEKDHLYHVLNRIKKVSREQGSHNTSKLWRYARSLNDELARKIAKAIINYAEEMQCDVIVFEYLDMHKAKGKAKQKLHLWKKNAIQGLVTYKAHKAGIRISRICAWGTSKLAFDGSGVVVRGKDAGFTTNELCQFTTGKVYNCDLSASYNIGARYFIRTIEKTQPVRCWSAIQAKVPDLQKRTLCTYNTLLELNKAM